jgi:Tol biopolymer transport system component
MESPLQSLCLRSRTQKDSAERQRTGLGILCLCRQAKGRDLMRCAPYLIALSCLLFLSTCKDIGNPIGEGPIAVDDGQLPCTLIRIVAPNPYSSPTWHPSGSFLVFNHTPLREVYITFTKSGDKSCIIDASFGFQGDSGGVWRINRDGTDMRRVLPIGLGEPAWAPDGQWIAFEVGAQIFKMRFTGASFDTTTLVQLTYQGSNFHPAWSPDGQWIAYSQTSCEGPNACGIWLMSSDGRQQRFLATGAYPSWYPTGLKILYVTGAHTEQGYSLGDSLWLYDVANNRASFVTFLGGRNNLNRLPRYSPDGTKIAFASRPIGELGNIWVMSADGSSIRQLTTEGTLEWLSWSPDGREIAYVAHNYGDLSFQNEQNGTIWSVDLATGQKRQITFNSIKRYIKNE